MTEPTYNGQPLNQGELSPHFFEGEGYATLQCGGTTVRLSYSALHLLNGWIAMGSRGYGRTEISGPILRAISAVTGEAAVGRKPR